MSDTPRKGKRKKKETEMNRNREYNSKGFGYNRPQREMHKVTCSDCGTETEVPFRPDGTRPVYCRECYQKHRPKRF